MVEDLRVGADLAVHDPREGSHGSALPDDRPSFEEREGAEHRPRLHGDPRAHERARRILHENSRRQERRELAVAQEARRSREIGEGGDGQELLGVFGGEAADDATDRGETRDRIVEARDRPRSSTVQELPERRHVKNRDARASPRGGSPRVVVSRHESAERLRAEERSIRPHDEQRLGVPGAARARPRSRSPPPPAGSGARDPPRPPGPLRPPVPRARRRERRRGSRPRGARARRADVRARARGLPPRGGSLRGTWRRRGRAARARGSTFRS